MRTISIRGASEHNLKGIDLDIPHETLTVVTGLSGSGKSSLAFDTIFREGQRRYIESLSSYARQFLGQMERPRVDHIEGLSPAAAIDQRTVNKNPRSTVGTMTEVSDYLRLLFARIGRVHCHRCGTEIRPQTADQIVDQVLAGPDGPMAHILAPVVRHRKGEHRELLAQWRASGYVRARIDSQIHRLDDAPVLARTKWHDIEVVVDRIRIAAANRERITDSLETALNLAEGLAIVATETDEQLFSSKYGCPTCGLSVEPPEPAAFSFNSRRGACAGCQGLGRVVDFDPEKLVRNPSLSIRQGALSLTNSAGYTLYARMPMTSWVQLGRTFGFSVDAPWKDLSEDHVAVIFHGSGRRKFSDTRLWESEDGLSGGSRTTQKRWLGLIPLLRRRSKTRDGLGDWVQQLLSEQACPACGGARLRKESLAVRFNGLNIAEVNAKPVSRAREFLGQAALSEREAAIAGQLLREIDLRLDFLQRVGLSYLSLDRPADTLAGGEAQRIRLAAQIGSGLEGVLYVLDEPSIGLHHRDNDGLLRTLQALRDRGNTVLVVEHDESTIRSADYVVDIGPGAGDEGGHVVASGTPGQVAATDSPTGRYLRGEDEIPIPKRRRPAGGRRLKIVGARAHNLKNIDVTIRLGTLTCVTGVSGSGKSSLVDDILKRALAARLHGALDKPGPHDRIEGVEHVNKVIEIDQSPIGRNPRSNPATYSGLFDHVRDLFHRLPDARARGYKPGRFSFNVKGGRCEACEGRGSRLIEMQFMGDVEIACEACGGARFNRETLKVRYKGKSIAEILDMRVKEALEFFGAIPAAGRILQTMADVGLGYLPLGQSSTTLSGGEAQRLKLSSELARPPSGHTLYILDEPTTGLHFADAKRLVQVVDRLVDAGNTVVVVEHNPEIIKVADWIIDLGPEGGDEGGYLVTAGTPEEVAQTQGSHTGALLTKVLARQPLGRPSSKRPADANGRSGDGHIVVRSARKHNLKSVDVSIPKEKITVITGVSGSGKSTLAMETIFSEGQRRFVECLSSYARQFLGRLEDAQVESISGLAPAIAIGQENVARTPRSLVATSTEIYDYLRVLYARAGRPHCPKGHGPIVGLTSGEIIQAVGALGLGARVHLLARLDEGEGARDPTERLRELLKAGFVRARVNGRILDLSGELPKLSKRRRHEIEVIIDRLVLGPGSLERLGDSVELALARGGGSVVAEIVDESGATVERLPFSNRPVCAQCGSALEGPLTPRHFSFNSYTGACPECEGLGTHKYFDPELVVPDRRKSFAEGAIAFLDPEPIDSWWGRWVAALAHEYGFDPYGPWSAMSLEAEQAVLFGSGDRVIKRVYERRDEATEVSSVRLEAWDGFIPIFWRWYQRTKDASRHESLERFMRERRCEVCQGTRLQPMVRSVRFAGKTIAEVLQMNILQALGHFESVTRAPQDYLLRPDEIEISTPALREINNRLQFLEEVGVGYLTLDRSTASLSGGEAQRIRLATQVGTRLVGAIYVLDEPSIGLHQRDIHRLLGSLERLKDLGNTVIVIEHDEATIRHADYVIDLGPGAGENGGRVVAQGTAEQLQAMPESATGRALAHNSFLDRVKMVPRLKRGEIRVVGARANNLKNIDVPFPLGCFTAVTGVSGSGKSTLVDTILQRALRRRLHGSLDTPGEHDGITVDGVIDKIVVVDQTPIGRSARSCPATYIGAFDEIRNLYARLPDAKALGFGVHRFSFNEGPGKCPACRGEGYQRISMQFLADVEVLCEVCNGRRYNAQTLRVSYRGMSIADVLEMTAQKALEHFDRVPRIKRHLQVLCDVGLGYMRLGQSSTSLSGGEAQRIKLAAELCRPATGKTLYLLDEPTVGLHPLDVDMLLNVLNRLVAAGNTVIVIEHDLKVIAQADHVIDLGPEGGDAGGYVIAAGTPMEVSRSKISHTGAHLKLLIERITAAA